ncbi:MAG: ComF family protein [Bacteroidales bacterium]|nr:ComF family protein [Bacteroidales bacterium]
MPRECLVCGRELSSKEEFLCLMCEADLPQTYYWQQPHNPMADKLNAALEKLSPDTSEYSYAAALMFYHGDNPYKSIPQALKYRYNIPAGRHFAGKLGEKLASATHFQDVDAVIPVPLHWTRRWKRGYNQAEIIADEIARRLGAKLLPRALSRSGSTVSQTTLDAPGRLDNVSGVFRPRVDLSGYRHILLVDDTFTTGATLASCITTIRGAVAPDIRISAATLAAVDD